MVSKPTKLSSIILIEVNVVWLVRKPTAMDVRLKVVDYSTTP